MNHLTTRLRGRRAAHGKHAGRRLRGRAALGQAGRRLRGGQAAPSRPGGHRRRGLTRAGTAAGGGLLGAGAAAMATYPRWREWCLTWGATPGEVAATLPGDELLAGPEIISTRAIGVAAPPAAIWPLLVQMGPGRGGAYTYDWIENLLGLGMHSADKILPQFQDLKVGDAQQLGRRGPTMRVAHLEPGTSLVLRSDDGNWVWAFTLMPDGAGTRLISRNRIATPGASRLARALTTYVMEPGSLIMERKMLLGLRQRAEALARDSGDQPSTGEPPSELP